MSASAAFSEAELNPKCSIDSCNVGDGETACQSIEPLLGDRGDLVGYGLVLLALQGDKRILAP